MEVGEFGFFKLLLEVVVWWLVYVLEVRWLKVWYYVIVFIRVMVVVKRVLLICLLDWFCIWVVDGEE